MQNTITVILIHTTQLSICLVSEEAERFDADDVRGGGHPGRAVGAHLVAGAGALQRPAPLQPLQGMNTHEE